MYVVRPEVHSALSAVFTAPAVACMAAAPSAAALSHELPSLHWLVKQLPATGGRVEPGEGQEEEGDEEEEEENLARNHGFH